MKRCFLFFALFSFFCGSALRGQVTNDMIITGVIDGPLSGGTPKAVEFYVVNDIPDLSLYGFGSANNGGGSDGQEFTFPAVSATAGDYIYVATETTNFTAFFGFAPDYTSSAISINGDDAIELFFNGAVIDVFGDINVDGTGQPWEYMDGWAYRKNNTGPDGSTFVLANWTFSGPNALDGETSNATATTPWPIGSYLFPITLASFEARYEEPFVLLSWQTVLEIENDYILVERSVNGWDYKLIGKVFGQGTTYEGYRYDFVDKEPLSGVNYYRLCQVDFNGSKRYYGPVSIVVEGGWSLYPSLVDDRLQLHLDAEVQAFNGPLDYRVFDLQGVLYLKGRLNPGGKGEEAIVLYGLPAGLYVLHWTQGAASGLLRFVKK